ncbi:serine hydrolase [Pseudarthrobacter sp. YALA5]|uniref:serine hydrolase domain-containing protein n=1 Tax=Pseudarthrobacter sp. DSP2-3-2b1 TaxID=2804661 RepID=UPI00103FF165
MSAVPNGQVKNNHQDVRRYGDHRALEALSSSLGRSKTRRRTAPAAIAMVRDGVLATASAGAPLDADYEIGSVSKGLTGLLYEDARHRGELDGGITLGALLPLEGCALAGVRLETIARHSSGLPRLPANSGIVRKTANLWLHGANPYGETLEELLAQARQTRLLSPKPRYSNLGFELLGHAIAAAAGTPYRELMTQRIAAPLGLASLYAPSFPHELRQTALSGRTRGGRIMQPWTGEALAPAGGWRANIQDMGKLTMALLEGTAPGNTALDPVARFAGPAARIGSAWLSLDVKGRTITCHNGATGGFRSWVGLDREAGTAVVLLSATASPLDRHGFRLLLDLPART